MKSQSILSSLRLAAAGLVVFSLASAAAPLARGQATTVIGAKPDADIEWARFHPSFYPVGQRPGKPQVLLIGDSISMDYTLHVRGMLGWAADVHRPSVNCGSTVLALRDLDSWLGGIKWDVIHFNWGLHDIHTKSNISLEQYTSNLRELIARLRTTGARLIWATTTPVPSGGKTRDNANVVRYNAAAAKIMQDEGVLINDLYSMVVRQQENFLRAGDVHFTRNGSAMLAKPVALSILVALGQPADLNHTR